MQLTRILTAFIVTFAVWSALAAPVTKLSDVISAQELEAEIAATVAELDAATASDEAFQAAKGKLSLTAAQLAVFCQALAESDGTSKLKTAAPSIRDAAIQFGQSASLNDAKQRFNAIKSAAESTATVAKVEFEWANLARKRTLMECLRQRTDQVRKAMRRPKDPVIESRHASAMAVVALAIAAQADDLPNEADRLLWNDWSLELQREMTLTAAAMREKNAPQVLEHFKAAQTACDRCHEKFKR